MTTGTPAARHQADEAAQANLDARAVLGTASGRRFVFSLLAATGWDGLSFTNESERLTSYYEGRRSVGLELRKYLLAACPQDFARMEREAIEQEMANDDSGSGNDSD